MARQQAWSTVAAIALIVGGIASGACWTSNSECTPAGSSWCTSPTITSCEKAPRETISNECGKSGASGGTAIAVSRKYTGLSASEVLQAPCESSQPGFKKLGCASGTTCCWIKEGAGSVEITEQSYSISLLSGSNCGGCSQSQP